MIEISRDGRRVYFTNSLYSTWDTQFYPDGVPGAQAMAQAGANGGIELAADFHVDVPRRLRGPPDPARGRRLLDQLVLLPVRVRSVGWMGRRRSGPRSSRAASITG